MRMPVAVLFAALCAAPLHAEVVVDDSDLGASPVKAQEARERLQREAREKDDAWVFRSRADAAPRPLAGGPAVVTGRFLIHDRDGALKPARLGRARLVGSGAPADWAALSGDGSFALPLPEKPAGDYRVRFSLDNALWAARGPKDAPYQWESAPFAPEAGSGWDLGAASPVAASENARLGVLHLTFLRGRDYLAREGDLEWWQKTLTVHWPGAGNFFSPSAWSLDITDASHWDVNLHELGHAVMHGAMKPSPAGGQHYIDRCYTEALAWSEGWASFFAAAVALRRDDPDARFEFLVPRMAPIRVEHVPASVCSGASSEWRVAAGLWDLYDEHPDGGDAFAASFGRLWRPLRGKRHGSLASGWALLRETLPPEERAAAEKALIHNTLLPARPELMAVFRAAAPAWDGAP